MAGHFLLSARARNLSLRELDRISEEDAYALFVRLRWNHGGMQACPACGCVDHHYVIRGRGQWRCKEKGCGRTFSVTSGTKFADRKLPFKDLLRGIVIYATHPKGISAATFANLMGIAYMSAFSLLHKLRESLWQTRDLTLLICTES